jgi:hypothetical protein
VFSCVSRNKLQDEETACKELISNTKTLELENLGKFLYKQKSVKIRKKYIIRKLELENQN